MREAGGQAGRSLTDAASAAIRVIIFHLWIIIVARVWEVSSSPIGGAVWPAPAPPDVSGRHHVTPPCRYLPTYSVVHKTLSWADLLICAAIFQIYRKEKKIRLSHVCREYDKKRSKMAEDGGSDESESCLESRAELKQEKVSWRHFSNPISDRGFSVLNNCCWNIERV